MRNVKKPSLKIANDNKHSIIEDLKKPEPLSQDQMIRKYKIQFSWVVKALEEWNLLEILEPYRKNRDCFLYKRRVLQVAINRKKQVKITKPSYQASRLLNELWV
jgi:hypothetical protein